MATITEDYVSFEIAKLLKEKGFDEGCRSRYGSAGSFSYEKYEIEASGCEMHNAILAPTLQMAMKWLREVHNIHITIYYSAFLYGTHPYYWSIDKIDSIPRANTQIKTSTSTHDYSFAHYEKACESAIRYCLENLI